MNFNQRIKNTFISLGIFCSTFIMAQTCPQISTYFGTTQVDEFKGVCKDTKGNIYAIGNTYNTDLPVTPGAFQPLYKGDYEPFLVKFDSCGSLIWCTYFGTTAFDSGEKIAYSSDSTIVITGITEGTDLDTTYNCFQPVNNGLDDCFLAKFDLNGQPKWVTYFGGSQGDFSYALTIDHNNNIIIGGTSLSPTLYPTSQSFQPNLAGAVDAFLAKFNKKGQFKFSTFYGGSNAEDIHDVTTDVDGNILGIGGSYSNNLNTSPTCMQPSSNGSLDVYLIKLDSIGNRIFSTYIGGSLVDDAFGVSTDPQKNIYLTGQTTSNDFYHTAVSYQTSIAGQNDNYCLKLTPTGTLLWSTIFGGSFFDLNVHNKIDANNNIYSLINSQSSDFPMVGTGNYTVYNGANDIVIAKISTNGQLLWTTFKGGSGDEISGDLVLLHNKIIVCGSTSSPDFPVIANNYQMSNGGQDDGFLTTITMSININTSLKYYYTTNCEPSLNYNSNNNYVLNIPCNMIDKIIIYDLLGRKIDELEVKENKVDLDNLNFNQVYIITGVSKENGLMFSQKLFLQNK